MAFQFKQFHIADDNCAMKVGVDAVLLGAWCNTGNAEHILDIGTGSGVIALMLAQRSEAEIHAIEIDPLAAAQAGNNASLSPWSARLSAMHISLQDFISSAVPCYDLVVCNPPFFNNSLLSPAPGRNRSRHSAGMPHDLLARAFSRLTNPMGKCCVILPLPESILFESLMKEQDFFVTRRMLITPKPGKSANRALLEFERNPVTETHSEMLSIRNSDNSYSNEYKELTKAFYLNF